MPKITKSTRPLLVRLDGSYTHHDYAAIEEYVYRCAEKVQGAARSAATTLKPARLAKEVRDDIECWLKLSLSLDVSPEVLRPVATWTAKYRFRGYGTRARLLDANQLRARAEYTGDPRVFGLVVERGSGFYTGPGLSYSATAREIHRAMTLSALRGSNVR